MSDNFDPTGQFARQMADFLIAIQANNKDLAKEKIAAINEFVTAQSLEDVNIPSIQETVESNRQFAERKGLIQTIVEGVGGIIEKGMFGTLFGTFDERMGDPSTALNKMFADMVRVGQITEEMVETLKSSVLTKNMFGYAILWIAVIVIQIGSFKHTMDAVQSESNQRINERYRPNLPGLGEMMRAGFIDPSKVGKIREILARQGYKDEHMDLMFISQYATYTVDETFRLWLRGVLSDQDLVKRMREHGFTDTRLNELKELYNILPPISDILLMLSREAFEPDQIAKFGLGDEFPEEAVEYGQKQGLSRFWTEKYWFTHWQHASPGQVLEMLHRLLITEEDVYEYYRLVEIPPYWRDLLMKISYTPYSRVDIRRMHTMGVVDEEEVYLSYRHQGYDHEHAVNLTKFSLQVKVEAQKDLTRSQMTDAYKLGLISRDKFIEYLDGTGYDHAESVFIADYTDYKEQLKIADETIKMIGDRYKSGMIDEPQARELLTPLELPSAKIDYYINLWDTARFKGRRRPTKTELGDLFNDGIIDAEMYVYEMHELGYDERHIMMFLEQLTVRLGLPFERPRGV